MQRPRTSPPPAPPPQEYQDGCKAADRAAVELDQESEQAAARIRRRRESGRWTPPRRPRPQSAP